MFRSLKTERRTHRRSCSPVRLLPVAGRSNRRCRTSHIQAVLGNVTESTAFVAEERAMCIPVLADAA